jgi:hypothetical protein
MATRQTKGRGSPRSTGERSKSGGERSKSGGGARKGASRNGGSSNGHVSAAQVARHARAQMRELTGQPVEGVLAVRRSDDGGWEVTVQVLELQRVPNSTDVLGAYVLALDESGEVTEYRRTRRYYRNQVEED